MTKSSEALGPCGLCGRPLEPGASINQHHLVPKTFGGTVAVWIHKVCHNKIHSVFTERELTKSYSTFELLLGHAEIMKFVKWVRKKPNTFYKKTRASQQKLDRKRK